MINRFYLRHQHEYCSRNNHEIFINKKTEYSLFLLCAGVQVTEGKKFKLVFVQKFIENLPKFNDGQIVLRFLDDLAKIYSKAVQTLFHLKLTSIQHFMGNHITLEHLKILPKDSILE